MWRRETKGSVEGAIVTAIGWKWEEEEVEWGGTGRSSGCFSTKVFWSCDAVAGARTTPKFLDKSELELQRQKHPTTASPPPPSIPTNARLPTTTPAGNTTPPRWRPNLRKPPRSTSSLLCWTILRQLVGHPYPNRDPRIFTNLGLSLDFDPEAIGTEFSDGEAHGDSDSESGSDDEADNVDRAREHYVSVGKSRLRKQGPDLEALGEAYAGSRVDRSKLYDEDDEEESGSEDEGLDEDGEDEHDPNGPEVYSEDEEIPSDDAMGSDDEEKFGKWGFKGSRTTEGGRPPQAGDKVVGDSDEESGSEDEDEDSNSDQSGSGVSEGEEEEEDQDESDIEDRDELDKLLSNEQKLVCFF